MISSSPRRNPAQVVRIACAIAMISMLFHHPIARANTPAAPRAAMPATALRAAHSGDTRTTAPAPRPKNFFQRQRELTMPTNTQRGDANSTMSRRGLPQVDYSKFHSTDFAKMRLPVDAASGQPVVARVSGRAITLPKFQSELKFVAAEASRGPVPEAPASVLESAMTEHVLENLILVEIFRDYATTHSLRIADRDVDALLETLNKGRRTGRRIEDTAIASGMTPTMLRQQLRDRLLSTKVDEHIARNVPFVEMSELNSTAATTMDRGGVMTTDTVRLRRIFVPEAPAITAAGGAKTDTAAETKALKIATRARTPGVDFADLARANSADATARARGGDIGWHREWRLNLAVSAAVRKTAVGGIAGPVRVRGGYEILKVEARIANDQPIIEHATRVQRAILAWRDRARKNAPVEIFI